MKIMNARIESTTLGYDDHGMATCWLRLSYDGSSQGFGGYELDGSPTGYRNGEERRGSAFGMQHILRILQTVGVEKWEDLVGQYVRAEVTNLEVVRIGHIIHEVWFDPRALWHEMNPTSGDTPKEPKTVDPSHQAIRVLSVIEP